MTPFHPKLREALLNHPAHTITPGELKEYERLTAKMHFLDAYHDPQTKVAELNLARKTIADEIKILKAKMPNMNDVIKKWQENQEKAINRRHFETNPIKMDFIKPLALVAFLTLVILIGTVCIGFPPKHDCFIPDSVNFTEKTLTSTETNLLDTLNSYINIHDTSTAANLVNNHQNVFREITDKLLLQGLYSQSSNDLVKSKERYDTARNIALIFENQMNDQFPLNEYLFFTNLDKQNVQFKIRVELIYKIANDLLNDGKFKKAIECYKKALNISKKIGDKKRVTDILLKMSYIAYQSESQIDALQYAKESLENAQAIGYVYKEIYARQAVVFALMEMGEYQKALPHVKKGAILTKKLNHSLGEVIFLERQGRIQKELGNLQEAETTYQHTLGRLKNLNRKDYTLMCFDGLAEVYKKLGDYEKSARFYESSLELAKELGDSVNQAVVLGNLGELYGIYLENYEEGKEYLEKALQIAKNFNNHYLRADIELIYSKMHKKLGEFDLAVKYSKEAFEEINQTLP